MTVYPKRPCAHVGCRKYSEPGCSYCAEHESEHKEFLRQKRRERWNRIEEQRLSANERGYTSAWVRARKQYLMEHPLCAMCGKPATDVDHIVPHRGDRQLFWNRNNWQSLCHECHSRKTLTEVARTHDESWSNKKNQTT